MASPNLGSAGASASPSIGSVATGHWPQPQQTLDFHNFNLHYYLFIY